jgi:Phage integrase, N-terminal SAM-like domain
MNTPSIPSAGLVPVAGNLPSSSPNQFPEIIMRAGKRAVFAADEFFFGRIRNEHTRAAYLVAVKRFLKRAEREGLELNRITPRDVGQYLDGLRNENTSVVPPAGLLLGSTVTNCSPVFLTPKLLSTHLHILGSTGVGKPPQQLRSSG